MFDVLGTLQDEDAGQLAAAEEVVAGPSAVDFVARWRTAFHGSVTAVREGCRPYASSEALHADAVRAASTGTGVPVTDAQVQRLSTFGRRLDPFPEVVEVLRRLAASHALVALTDAGTAQAFAMSRYAGLRWTTLVSGETFGAFKPDARMHEHLVRALELDPARCVFVAAHPWDLDAAARHGLGTGYVDRAGSSPEELAEYARRFDHVAADPGSLAARLAG